MKNFQYRVKKPIWWEDGELFVSVGDQPRRARDCSLEELAPIRGRYRDPSMEEEMLALEGIIGTKMGLVAEEQFEEKPPLDLDVDPEFVLAMAGNLHPAMTWERRVKEALRLDEEAASDLAFTCQE